MTMTIYGPPPILLSPSSQQTGTENISGEAQASDFKSSGLTGATAGARFVGATASGAPLTGTYIVGDFIIDRTGTIYVCTVAGTPGTWVQISGGSSTTLSTVTGALSGNVALAVANQFYDGPTVSCTTGTWLLFGQVTVSPDATLGGEITAKLWDGTTVYATGENTLLGGPSIGVIALSGRVVASTTTTYKISSTLNNAGSGTIWAAVPTNAAGNNASRLSGIKIA